MKKLYSLLFFLLLPLANNPAVYTGQKNMQHDLLHITEAVGNCLLTTYLHVAAQSHLHMVGKVSVEPSKQDLRLEQFDNAAYPHLAKFFKAHPLPKDFAEALSECKKDVKALTTIKSQVGLKSKGPIVIINNICFKAPGEIDRVLNAQRMANYLEKKDTHKRLGVAEKHFAYLGDGLWIVMARQIPDTPVTKKFDRETATQFIDLADTLGFSDWNELEEGMPKNWHHTDSKLICIDTANNSFTTDTSMSFYGLGELWKKHFQKEDLKIIETKYNAGSPNQENFTTTRCTYDDADNDFRKVSEEFSKITPTRVRENT